MDESWNFFFLCVSLTKTPEIEIPFVTFISIYLSCEITLSNKSDSLCSLLICYISYVCVKLWIIWCWTDWWVGKLIILLSCVISRIWDLNRFRPPWLEIYTVSFCGVFRGSKSSVATDHRLCCVICDTLDGHLLANF